MLPRTTGRTLFISAAMLAGAWGVSLVHAQNPEVALIQTIRNKTSIQDSDKDRIRRWVDWEVDALQSARQTDRPAQLAQFLESFRKQYHASDATPQFRAVFSAQTTAAAVDAFAKADTADEVARGLAHQLVDMDRAETIDGLIAGLATKSSEARFLCARGLEERRGDVAANANKLQAAVAALKAAAVREPDPIALGRMYAALSLEDQVAVVFPVFLDVFDRRLEYRRGPALNADGAELEAYEFFRQPAVLNALNAAQQKDLVLRLAVFLRLDAERYDDADIAPPNESGTVDQGYYERDYLERSLVSLEAILTTLVSGKDATITSTLRTDGWSQRQAILDTVHEWVGTADPATQGVLNAAPWNVPLGAP